MKFNQWISQAQQQLQDKGLESAQVDWLVMDLLGWSRTTYLMNKQQVISEQELHLLQNGLERLLKGEPEQYVVGFASFMGRDFKVTPDVLIPRPETEEVVAHFMNQLPQEGTIADIGTGSGIIAISIKKAHPQLSVYASDISCRALEVAQRNAQQHDAAIQFLCGDTLHPFIEKKLKLEGLISNPPYIDCTEQNVMSTSTLNYEPHIALFAEDEGLKIYRSILIQLPKVMKEGAPVVFEIGYQQGAALKSLITSLYPQLVPKVIKDINGNDRIISFKWSAQ